MTKEKHWKRTEEDVNGITEGLIRSGRRHRYGH